MPAATRIDLTDSANGDHPTTEPVGLSDDSATPQTQRSVTEFLDMAVTAAQDTGMSHSELMGLFFYYAHCVAEASVKK